MSALSEDPAVIHPRHYSSARFGVECIEFTRLMMFNPGNAFKYVFRCEEKDEPVQDLEKARVYWGWAFSDGEAICPAYNRAKLNALYWRHLAPKLETDWMARVLGDILFEEWDRAGDGIDRRHEFFVLNGGRA